MNGSDARANPQKPSRDAKEELIDASSYLNKGSVIQPWSGGAIDQKAGGQIHRNRRVKREAETNDYSDPSLIIRL